MAVKTQLCYNLLQPCYNVINVGFGDMLRQAHVDRYIIIIIHHEPHALRPPVSA